MGSFLTAPVTVRTRRRWWGSLSVYYTKTVFSPFRLKGETSHRKLHALVWQWWREEDRGLAAMGGKQPPAHRVPLVPVFASHILMILGVIAISCFGGTGVLSVVLINSVPRFHRLWELMAWVALSMGALAFLVMLSGITSNIVSEIDEYVNVSMHHVDIDELDQKNGLW